MRVESDDPPDAGELIAFADEALAGLAHRRVDVEDAAAAARLRPQFEAAGWRALPLLYMHHDEPLPPGPDVAVQEVPYDDVHALRVAWHDEDFPGQDADEHLRVHARAIALARDARVLASVEDGRPVAFAQLERVGDAAEITLVYVSPDARGAGRGTALTRAAVAQAGPVGDLWIGADADDRPRHLYARLGFRPVWTVTQFLRLPGR